MTSNPLLHVVTFRMILNHLLNDVETDEAVVCGMNPRLQPGIPWYRFLIGHGAGSMVGYTRGWRIRDGAGSVVREVFGVRFPTQVYTTHKHGTYTTHRWR